MKKYIAFFILFLIPCMVSAQWEQTNGPYGGEVHCFAVSGTKLFVGTSGGVFLSTNNGTNWNAVNYGLTLNNLTEYVSAIAVSGTNIFAGTNGPGPGSGIFLSTNNGTSWTSVNSGLTSQHISALLVSGTTLFAGTDGGIFLSTNNGTSWVLKNNGLTNLSVSSIAVSGTNIFVGTSGGMFLSTNSGTNWIIKNSGLTNLNVVALSVSGINVFAGTDGGVFLTTNNGTNWNAKNNGLTTLYVQAFVFNGSNFFAGTRSGIFLSTNNGTSWAAINSGLMNLNIQALIASGTRIFTGTATGFNCGIFLSTNNGTSWTSVNNGFTGLFIPSLAVNGTSLFAGTDGGGVFLSSNNGSSWIPVNNGLTSQYVFTLTFSGTKLFAGGPLGGVYLSTNNGTSWSTLNNGIMPYNVYSLAVSGTNIFAGTDAGGIFLSTNNGTNWTAVNIGLTNLNISTVMVSGAHIFAGSLGNGVFLSTNNGTSWTAVNNGLTNLYVNALAVSDNKLFAGTFGSGIYLSTNNGTSWNEAGLTDLNVMALAISGTNLFAGTENGIYFSNNNGASWFNMNQGFISDPSVESLLIANNYVLAGTNGQSVWKRPLSDFISLPSINQPSAYDKWISGETFTISWTPLPWANVNIKCIINSGTSVEQPLLLAFQYPGAFNQFPWNIPDTILSYRSKIIIENAANPTQKIESDIFRIKPYLLTRVNPDETYYEYKKDRDQWGFWNDPTHMWPLLWYQQFDYRGIDQFTGSQYSQWQGNSVFLSAQAYDYPDWVSWVNTFTTDLCYQNISQANYSLIALNKWNQIKGNWPGSCFGIAISNAIIFRNKSDFFQRYPTFTSFTNPVEVHTSDIVKKTINEIWVHQFGEPHYSYQSYELNNKTTNQTLQEIRSMLKSDTDPIRILGIINNGGGGGGHMVNVYKLSKDKQNPNLFKVFIYDNNRPDDVRFIQVNTVDSNGRGSWSYQGMGGDKFFILSDPANSYLSNPTFDVELSKYKDVNSNDSILQVFNDEFQDFVIYDSFGRKSGYINDTFYLEIPNSIPKMIQTGYEIPPYGFDMRLGNYKINISKFRNVSMKFGLVSGNKSFSYFRNDAINNQTDKLYFDGALSVSNSDTSLKSISLSNILDETTHEKLFAFSSLELAQNDSVKIENLGSDNFKLTSYGSSKSYDIELNLASQSQLGRFMNVNIPLPSNSSHTFIPNWNNVTTSQLVILQDIGNNGTIDDTIRVINIISNIEQGSLILPDNYSLYQNYPNPFNPSTLIKYDIKKDGFVSLKVYNILGKEVASLVNEEKCAGRYEVEFNGSNLGSGIYYYRLQAGEYSETKKMLLLK